MAPNGNWSINGNGFQGQMALHVDGQGNVTGSMYGDTVRGFWDETAQRLVVYREVHSPALENIQVYTGYRFNNHLAGSFEAFAGTAIGADRTVYGWFATQ